jgi:hypothetical protein
MKRTLFVVSIFSVCSLAAAALGQELGPGEKGASIRIPGLESSRPQEPMPGSKVYPSNYDNPFSPSPFAPSAARPKIAQMPSNDVSINRDIEVSERQGPWVIYVMSYSGEDAPKLAREFVAEMRNNMNLAAYVYNSGAKEKEAEFKRVQKAKQDQLDALHKAGLNGSFVAPPIRTVRIEEQTAVLIDGGFRTREEALEGLKKIRKMKLPEGFEKRVKLDFKVAIELEKVPDRSAKFSERVKGEAEAVLLNPFARAFPARNPAIEHHGKTETDSVDAKLLQVLNREETFTVLKTKKPFTLAIKQYNTQAIVARNQREADGFLERFRKGLTLKNGEWSDQAAQSAHDLADAFRKSGLPETYVLHAKYCSYVTVGGYDSANDSRLTIMQNFLESQLQKEAYRPLELMPRPTPMAIPY